MSFSNEEEIYQEHVLDHYEDPYHRGSCPQATHLHEDDNPLCGDVVQIELRIEPDGTVSEAWFDGDGCCISQSSASMLVEAMEGKTVEDIKAFSADQMLQLFQAKLTPNRQKMLSTFLARDADRTVLTDQRQCTADRWFHLFRSRSR